MCWGRGLPSSGKLAWCGRNVGRILQFGKDTMITVLDLIDSQGETP